MFRMYTFICDYGIVQIEWTWNEIELRARRYAEENAEKLGSVNDN